MEQIAHKLDEKTRTEDVLIDDNYNFKSLLLNNLTSQGLTDAGFYKPSPIQLKAIPLGKCGLDLIVQSKSGTGKTAVFAIIALEMLKCEKDDVQVLILAPTREIAVQIESVINIIGKHAIGLKVGCFIGGLPIEQDIQNLKKCNVAIGAPGRITHLIENGHLKTDNIRLFILDEVDKLMEKSFQKNINYIYNKLPARKQILACSATYTNELRDFLENYMQLPTFVTPQVGIPILLGLRQFVSVIKSNTNQMQKMNAKIAELIRLFTKVSFTQCLVFCNYQTHAETVSNFLNGKGWDTKYISGAQSQKKRLEAFKSLQKFQCRILISTDLTARGIDSANVDLVINYDVPYEAETYLHRMGRAGRYGSQGICVTIVTDNREMNDLQKLLGTVGGNELSIAILPKGETLVDDVWKLDVNTLPSISGVVNLDEAKKAVNLSESVLKIKEVKKNTTDVMSFELEKLSVVEQVSAENVNMEKKCKRNESVGKNQFKNNTTSKDNTVNSTQDLASSSTNDLISPASLYPWVPVTRDTYSNYDEQQNDSKKRRMSKPSEENTGNSSVDKVVAKNVGLYNISKLLTGDDIEFDTAAQSASYLLKNIKENEESRLDDMCNQLETQSCADILKNLDNLFPTKEPVKEPEISDKQINPLENIISLGYNFMCKGDVHWSDALGENYKPIEKQEVSEVEQDDGDEEEYFSEQDDEFPAEHMEDDRYANFGSNQQFDYRNSAANYSERLNYDEQAAGTSLENYYNNRFGNYFDVCINNFMQNVDNLSFQDRFAQWQYNMKSTRDFIQQNIYMDLMNYQYPRNYHN